MRAMSGRDAVLRLIAAFLAACGGAEPGQETTSDDDGVTMSASISSSEEVATMVGAASTTTAADDTGASGSSAAQPGESTGAPPELPACPSFGGGVPVGALVDPQIDETSGLVASRKQPGVLWLHNDSGDSARVFAIDETGQTLAELAVEGATAIDWEDMAVGPGPDERVDYLYIGDIGDNAEARRSVTIHRVPEPPVPARGPIGTAAGAEALVVHYPDRPHNAETLLSDPQTGDLFIVTKESRGPAFVFRIAADEAGPIEAELLGELPFGTAALPGSNLVTGGDVSPSGDLVAIRTYASAFAWRRAPGTGLEEAFSTEPCALPVALRMQGETIAIAAGADAYFTISEGASASVMRYDLAQ